jgi:hypothetical protein
MPWETPSYIELNMSAEIGGYQDEFDERAQQPDDLRVPQATDEKREPRFVCASMY